MDQLRKNNQFKRPRNSVDGMLSAGPSKSSSFFAKTPTAPKTSSSLPPVRNRLDDFSGMNGFSPAKQPVIEAAKSSSALGRQPRRGLDGAIDLSLPPAPKKSKRKLSRKQIFKRSLLSLALLIVLIGGALSGKIYLKIHGIFKGGTNGAAALQDNVDPSKLKGEGDGRVNILLLGIGGQGHDGPDLTDTMLVASIDPVNKKAAILSLPRDLYVPGTSNTKINSVYADAKYRAAARGSNTTDANNAGFDAVEKQVSDYMGIPIHYHFLIDFAGFEKAINTVGGVDINVDAANTVHEVLWDELTGKVYTLDVRQGQQHFDAQRALFYARSRETSPRGDFDRAERQRKLILALKDKVLSIGTFANPVKISKLTDDFGNHISSNMSINDVLRLYDIAKTINSSDVATVGLADPPNNYVTTATINGQSIVQPRAGLTDYTDIQAYVRNALKDGFIANENASIAVYNGTNTPGLATTKATELKSYGYNINTIADAPTKTYTKTIVVDLTKGVKKYTKHYLEQRFGTTAVETLPDPNITNPGNADFVIILGSN